MSTQGIEDAKEALAEAPKWQSELDSKLKEESTPDEIRISYKQVARAFPSTSPHSCTFEINIIECETLKQWAKERGWDVEQETGQLGEIVFTRVRK